MVIIEEKNYTKNSMSRNKIIEQISTSLNSTSSFRDIIHYITTSWFPNFMMNFKSFAKSSINFGTVFILIINKPMFLLIIFNNLNN